MTPVPGYMLLGLIFNWNRLLIMSKNAHKSRTSLLSLTGTRTLQVMEGMFKLDIQEYVNYFNEHIPRHSDRGPWTPESTIDALSVYHAGGEARLEELRKMFAAIGNKPVFILTSSDVAVDYKGVYAAILDNWGCQNLRGVHYSLANKGVTKYTYMNEHMQDVLHVGVPGLPTAQETVEEFKLRF